MGGDSDFAVEVLGGGVAGVLHLLQGWSSLNLPRFGTLALSSSTMGFQNFASFTSIGQFDCLSRHWSFQADWVRTALQSFGESALLCYSGLTRAQLIAYATVASVEALILLTFSGQLRQSPAV